MKNYYRNFLPESQIELKDDIEAEHGFVKEYQENFLFTVKLYSSQQTTQVKVDHVRL